MNHDLPCGKAMMLTRSRSPANRCIGGCTHGLFVLFWIVASLSARAEAQVAASHDKFATYRFSKPLRFEAIQSEELLAVELDGDVFEKAQDGFPDLRIVGDLEGDCEVPYLLRLANKTRIETFHHAWSVEPVSLVPMSQAGLEIVLQLDEDDPQPDGLTLATPLKDFHQRIRVFGSNDAAQWEPLVDEGVIFDYSRYMDVRSLEIEFRRRNHRWFRVMLDDVTSDQELELLDLTRSIRGGDETVRTESLVIQRRPMRIDRIDFWQIRSREHHGENHLREYPVQKYEVQQEPETQQTVVHFWMRRQPLSRLTLETTSRNFSRRAVVEYPVRGGIRTRWVEIGSSTLQRIEFHDRKQEHLTVTFPLHLEQEYRLVIDNEDSPPLEIAGLKAQGAAYELVFLAAPGERYRLLYGYEEATAPRYDTAAVLSALPTGIEPRPAQLGEALVRTPREASDWGMTGWLKSRWVWGPVIVLLVVLLGFGLYSASRRVEGLSAE
jgi:hypothetical protein